MNETPVDRGRLREKIEFVRDAVSRLEEIRSRGRREFLADPILQSASIRYLQTAIEAVIDMANHIVAREGLGIPKSYQEALDALLREGILPAAKGSRFRAMVRFRNRAVHLYERIDAPEVFDILEHNLADLETIVRAMVDRYLAAGRPRVD